MDLTIHSDQELENMKKQVENFRTEISAFDFSKEKHPRMHPRIIRAEFDALCAVYADMCEEITAYVQAKQS